MKLLDHAPIVQRDHLIGVGGGFGIVGYHDDGAGCLRSQFAQQKQDLFACFAVQVTGWFVGQQQGSLVNQGPRNRDPLLLPSRQLVRVVSRLLQPHLRF
jgi:hypothetical protein